MQAQAGGPISLDPDCPPLLVVIVDTEEEFDWAQPLSPSNTSVRTIEHQHLAQDIFAKYGVVPTYVIDYPVATSAAAVDSLGPYLKDGRCEIGAHLHPWVNPPHEEAVTPPMSYPGNLPPTLEREKLTRLTDAIVENFGCRPTVYKAGRYGIGPNTGAILEDLGYTVDVSVVPYTSFGADGGPDFTAIGFRPYWFGRHRRLLEIPLTCGFYGALAGWGPRLYPLLAGTIGVGLRVPGVCARLGALERIRLTPEGIDHAAHRRLTESLLARGGRVFSLAYHSPSLAPGNTPYVRDHEDLETFLDTLDRYCDYFVNELGGTAVTATQLRARLAPPVASFEAAISDPPA